MGILAVGALLLAIGSGAVMAADAPASPGSAETLRARYAELKDELRHNTFHRPLHIDSSLGPDGDTGSILALLDTPFAAVGAALSKPAQWCDVLILHLNIKYCRASTDSQATALHINIGKKFDQPLEQSHRVVFGFQLVANSPSYLQVQLRADDGPLDTTNYRIVLEAAPQGGQTLIRLSYSYSYGMVGWLAMKAYLATTGHGKVGFTVVGTQSNGEPVYVGGMRGVVERNTMRYYLAIEAFAGALSSPPPARVEKSLRDWFAAVERYPRQLHDMERGDYLDMKRREYSRQQAS